MVVLLSIISGLLSFAAFAPLGIWWTAPLSLAFLLALLAGRTMSTRIVIVTLYAASCFGPLLAWTNTYVGDTPWLILTVLQIVLTLPLALFGFNSGRQLIVFPSIWIAIEYIRGHFPFGGFGWGRLAFSQADAPYSQLARIGGQALVSFVVAALGVGIFLLFKRKFTAAAIIAVFVTALTTFSIASIPKIGAPNYPVVAVQGGVPQLGLDFNSRATAVFENHLRATDSYLAKRKGMLNIVIWPENSVDVDPFHDLVVMTQLRKLADKYSVPIIVGAVLQDGPNYQNASILVEPKTGVSSIYIKRHLTPFGEYIPLRQIAEIVSPYAKNVVDFKPGNRLVIHHIGNARLAPIICFELLDDSQGRALAKKSNALVIQTNSATFGLSPESRQQLGITRMRSIEHLRFSMSISTSGISAIIDPRGRVTHQTGQNRSAVIDAKIALIQPVSFSDRYGSPIEAALILLPLLGSTVGSLKRRWRDQA